VVIYIAVKIKLEIRSWRGSGIICSFNEGRFSKQEKMSFTSFKYYYITMRSNLKSARGITKVALKYNTCSDLLSKTLEKCVIGINSNITDLSKIKVICTASGIYVTESVFQK
jgi:hypothetical protein